MIEYTKLKETNRKVLRDVIPLKKPFTLLIEPSSLCNFNCKMCFQSIREDNYFQQHRCNMSMDIYKKVINDAKNWGGESFKVLKLCIYGEPLINRDFCEMLKMAKMANLAERIETTTNASLITEEVAEKLVEYQIDYIRVSIYSALPEKHRDITSSNVSIEQIHKNLELLKRIKAAKGSNKPFVAVKMLDTFGEENQIFMNRFEDVADEMYLDQPHNWGQSNISFIERLYENSVEQAVNKLENCNNHQKACPMPFTTLAVRANGDIQSCCIDWQGGTIIGNIKDDSLKNFWESKVLQDFWIMQLEGKKEDNPSCRSCEVCKSSHYIRDNIDGVSIDRIRGTVK